MNSAMRSKSAGKSRGRAAAAAMSPESKKSLVVALCIIASLAFSSFAQMAPFYPLKARSLDISVIYVGQVMATMAISQIISGFVVGKVMHKVGS